MKHRLVVCGAVMALLTLLILPAAMAYEEAPAAAAAPAAAPSDPLLRVLVSKGVITPEEAKFVGVGTPADQRDKLVLLLKEKGLLSTAELDELRTYRSVPGYNQPALQSATLTTQSSQAAPAKTETPKPAPPKVVPAVAPLRVLQLEPAKKDGLIPDVKLGSGARIKFYGFLKASAIYDSSSPYGNDFPLPGFIGNADTGPGAGNEFHIKARSARFGTNFEWPDLSDKWSLTGRFEYDWEGNFSRVNNRNISSIRSSMASIRLAWARLDHKLNASDSMFFLFGQDWTPFGSSTLPNLVESTGLGISFGTLYERDPQFRTGWVHVIGGDRKVTVSPEFAVVLPATGNVPSDLGNQLGYGERQGVDSGRPQVQGRFVVQWQFDKSPGVAPAQVIASAMQGRRQAVLRAADIPACVAGCGAAGANFYRNAFPVGLNLESDTWGADIEVQLPTRFVTLTTKYYQGVDLRFYFAGGLLSTFNDTAGMANILTAPSIDGSSTVAFGTNAAGAAVVARQRGVETRGGFVNLGFPLGRIFNANPAGRNAGWQLYLHYGYDAPTAKDARRAAAATGLIGNSRDKNDLAASTLLWKFNNFVTFGLEESYYRTRMSGGTTAWADRFLVPGSWPLWMGKPARSWHDLRSEFSTIFTF